MKNKQILLSLSIVLAFVSCISLFSFGTEIRKRNREILFEQHFLNVNDSASEVYPDRIKIESINVDLPVEVTTLSNSNWEYSDTSVLFMKQSGDLPSKGNKILYGHNYPNLLKNLKDLKQGDLIKLYSGNKDYNYIVKSASTVTSDQTHILFQTEDDRITIFTCSGFLDSKRIVVFADRIG